MAGTADAEINAEQMDGHMTTSVRDLDLAAHHLPKPTCLRKLPKPMATTQMGIRNAKNKDAHLNWQNLLRLPQSHHHVENSMAARGQGGAHPHHLGALPLAASW